jgi:hypothetical protein
MPEENTVDFAALEETRQSLASKPRLAAEPSAFYVFVDAIQKFLSLHLSAGHIGDIMHIGQVFCIKYHFNPLMESSKTFRRPFDLVAQSP